MSALKYWDQTSGTWKVIASGTPGQGVPAGGTTDQLLAKISATDYATAWVSRIPPKVTILTTVGAGTFTVTAGAKALMVECQGGGGTGGSALAAASNCACGSGGGGGGKSTLMLQGPLAASYPYVVGAGGRYNVPESGADSTFGSPAICHGWGGLQGAAGISSTVASFQPAGGLGAGGPALANCFVLFGQAGGWGNRMSGTAGKAGDGGASPSGPGRMGSNSGAQGGDGYLYGSGGAGALSLSTASFWGGSGAQGYIRITEFF